MDIDEIRARIKGGSYRLTAHATVRCKERGITTKDMETAIINGKIIEEYPDDKTFPSCLIFGHTPDGLPLHIVCSLAPISHIITLYFPDEKRWISYRTRRRKEGGK
ncbi:MAG: DUF4258 domain-containing protein [Firmicutes bacterium]|nr:DUF4258 domain-containing protein [Bacillota bacterium]